MQQKTTAHTNFKKQAIVIIALFCYHVLLITSGLYIVLCIGKNIFHTVHPIWLNVAGWGLTGGCIYCIRSLYLQYCVKYEWDNQWIVWHIIRPFVSAVCGVVSLLFVKAGLLLFEASYVETQSYYGVYALSFIAGLNVDNFIKKIESIFQELIGIKQTRISNKESFKISEEK